MRQSVEWQLSTFYRIFLFSLKSLLYRKPGSWKPELDPQNIYMNIWVSLPASHSEFFLDTSIFNIEFLFCQFFNNNTYVCCVAKLSKLHFCESLFSNPGEGDKFLKSRKTIGQICPVVSKRVKTQWNVTHQTHVVSLENGQNNNSIYRCF